MFRTFLAKFWIFTHFSRKIPIFGFARDIWRHIFVTPWPILVIEVSMVRGGQYLSIDTKFIETLDAKIQGGGLHNPRWLDVLQKKNRCLDEG